MYCWINWTYSETSVWSERYSIATTLASLIDFSDGKTKTFSIKSENRFNGTSHKSSLYVTIKGAFVREIVTYFLNPVWFVVFLHAPIPEMLFTTTKNFFSARVNPKCFLCVAVGPQNKQRQISSGDCVKRMLNPRYLAQLNDKHNT